MDNQNNTKSRGIQKSVYPFGEIKKVIAIMSGKGGVGKSSVTALMAASMREKGYSVGVLDGDITGPSIPRLFGIKEKAGQREKVLIPVETEKGTKIMSVNLLLPREDDPVIWRGPIISGIVKQFFEEVDWGDLDYLFVDMPPGTGDAPLTAMQSLPLDGLIIVSSPQELVGMIVRKAIHMAQMMAIPILGLVENMSYVECPDCGKKIHLFGESKVQKVVEETGINLLGQLPIIPEIARLSDEGRVEMVPQSHPDFFAQTVENFMKVV